MFNEITLAEHFSIVFKDMSDGLEQINKWNSRDFADYKILLERLHEVHCDDKKIGIEKKYTTQEKGKALEDLVKFLFVKTGIFTVFENIHTSSNEIDDLVILSDKGKFLKSYGFVDFIDDIFLSECKNHNKEIGVTWIGKFYSLLSYTNNHLGLFFSYYKLSGTGWKDSVGLQKKIYLKSSGAGQGIRILDMNKNDFDRIAEGESFLNMIYLKSIALINDVKFDDLIKKHPGEN